MSNVEIIQNLSIENMLAEVKASLSFATYNEILLSTKEGCFSFVVEWEIDKGKPTLSKETLLYLASTGAFSSCILGVSTSEKLKMLDLCIEKVCEEAYKNLWTPSEKIKRKTFQIIEKPAC